MVLDMYNAAHNFIIFPGLTGLKVKRSGACIQPFIRMTLVKSSTNVGIFLIISFLGKFIKLTVEK